MCRCAVKKLLTRLSVWLKYFYTSVYLSLNYYLQAACNLKDSSRTKNLGLGLGLKRVFPWLCRALTLALALASNEDLHLWPWIWPRP